MRTTLRWDLNPVPISKSSTCHSDKWQSCHSEKHVLKKHVLM